MSSLNLGFTHSRGEFYFVKEIAIDRLQYFVHRYHLGELNVWTEVLATLVILFLLLFDTEKD